MDSNTLQGRDARQKDLVPPDRLAACHASVIGCGAIGRQVALQLAALGATKLMLVDHDTVEVANLAAQGFYPTDLDRSKVDAVAEQCQSINPAANIESYSRRFNSSVPRTDIMFCCVDRIQTRKRIFGQARDSTQLFIDARMSAEVIRCLAANSEHSGNRYLETCFEQEQAFVGACTAKSTIYTANIAAGLMITQFTRWLRRMPIDHDVQLNLLSMELTVS